MAISTGCFYRSPLAEVLHWFGEYGFRDLEICSFPAHLDFHSAAEVERAARALEREGLNPLSFHAPFADRIDIASWEASVRRNSVAELRRACEAARDLGSRYIVLHPGPEQEGRLQPHEWYPKMQLAAESLNEVADHCSELGLTLLLENMLPHLMFGHISDMLYLLGAIRSVNVETCLDTGHAYLSGDLPLVANKLSGHLRMLHANDNLGERDDHLPPGRGKIDWEPLMEGILEGGFDGIVVLELAAGEDPAEVFAGAVEARDYLQGLAAALQD